MDGRLNPTDLACVFSRRNLAMLTRLAGVGPNSRLTIVVGSIVFGFKILRTLLTVFATRPFIAFLTLVNLLLLFGGAGGALLGIRTNEGLLEILKRVAGAARRTLRFIFATIFRTTFLTAVALAADAIALLALRSAAFALGVGNFLCWRSRNIPRYEFLVILLINNIFI